MRAKTPRDAAIVALTRQSRRRPNNASGLAALDTMHIAVELRAWGRCALGATLSDESGADRYLFFFGLEEPDGTWRMTKAAFGLVHAVEVARPLLYEFGTTPNTIDLVGFVSGRLSDTVTRLRLTLSDGGILEEPIDRGWVAVARDGDLRSVVTIGLIDALGGVVWSEAARSGASPA